jgi:hypothetical protein
LAFEAGGVEADVVEGLEVGYVGGEDVRFEAFATLETPLDGDHFFDEGDFGGFLGRPESGEVLLEFLVIGGKFAGDEDGRRR